MDRLLIFFTPVDIQLQYWRDDQLIRFTNEFSDEPSHVAALLKGRILRLIPGLQAAFVEVGLSRPGYLQEKDLRQSSFQNLMPGDQVLVEVVKDETHSKGARLRERFSVATRAVAYSAYDEQARVSHRIEGSEQNRLQSLMQSLTDQQEGAFVARTNAVNVSDSEIKRQAEDCLATWDAIFKKSQTMNAPGTVLAAPNLIERVLRDWPFLDPLSILIDDAEQLSAVESAAEKWLSPGSYECGLISKELNAKILETENLFSSKVTLKSGAFLLVEQTALGWTIDVNSGSNIGSQTIEKSAWEINSEVLAPLVQLISLREMSGTIVVDFLHMDVIPKWNELKKNLLKLLKAEHTGVHAECVPSMGIVLISRRRERPDIVTRNMKNCSACQGSGLQLKTKAMISRLYQKCEQLALQGHSTVVFKLHPETLKEIEKNLMTLIKAVKEKLNLTLEVEPLFQGRLDEIDFYIKKSSPS